METRPDKLVSLVLEHYQEQLRFLQFKEAGLRLSESEIPPDTEVPAVAEIFKFRADSILRLKAKIVPTGQK